MLTTQYRMHEQIMKFPSRELYDGQLIAHETVKARTLAHIQSVRESSETTVPLVFWDTQGSGMEEKDTEEESAGFDVESKCNEGEVGLVLSYLNELLQAGVSEEDVGVITPYSAQVGLLKRAIGEKWPKIEIGTVDGFQGREKEVIIVSLVRSNEQGEIGFLAEKRRLNVAMTRPKRHLCVIGDSETLSAGQRSKSAKEKYSDGDFLKKWMEFLAEEADVRYVDM